MFAVLVVLVVLVVHRAAVVPASATRSVLRDVGVVTARRNRRRHGPSAGDPGGRAGTGRRRRGPGRGSRRCLRRGRSDRRRGRRPADSTVGAVGRDEHLRPEGRRPLRTRPHPTHRHTGNYAEAHGDVQRTDSSYTHSASLVRPSSGRPEEEKTLIRPG
ncbi:hypothetical protein EBF04_18915 [Streptomyces sp. I6]|nr:hypothetical protein EBF04_18915 [Streptomyces sp. I6]